MIRLLELTALKDYERLKDYKRHEVGLKRHEVNLGLGHSSAIGNVSGPEVHLREM
jgi:hypothetical protein